MDPYPHGTKHLKGKEWIIAQFHCAVFLLLLLTVWLIHVLFVGWYQYLFKAEGYLIKAHDITEDVEHNNHKWWNKHHCEAAFKATVLNDPDDLVLFTWRVHPLYLSNDILYIKSKGYSAKVFNEHEKIYHSVQ